MRLLIEARNQAVAVEDGRICAATGRFDRVFRIRDGEVRPGLINAHDHLHRNHYGRLGRPPYANAYDWARDIQQRDRATIVAGFALPRRQALLAGAWKNLLSGVTHVVHHDPWEKDFGRDFPLTVVRIAQADSLGMTPQALKPPTGAPFALHLAEGVDSQAAAEIGILDARGLVTPALLAVHVVGADRQGIQRLRQSGCAMIHCPSSNLFLFHRTAPQALLSGVDVLLGTDSLLTGAGTLLDEIALACSTLGRERALAAVGETAARRLGVATPSLAHGTLADLAVFRRPLGEAGLADVALVMARGKLRVLDPVLAPGMRRGVLFTWRGVTRWLASSFKTYIAP